MASTRPLYDIKCNAEEPNDRIYSRYFDPESFQNFKCIAKGEGYFSGFVPKGSVDVDSELKNLGEPLSRCTYTPKILADHFSNIGNCNNHYDYTRLSNPLCTSREVGINRFQPVCADPQEHLSNPNIFNLGTDARKLATDTYKACVPKPIDYSASIPNGGTIKTYTMAGPILGGYPQDPLTSPTLPVPPYPHGSAVNYVNANTAVPFNAQTGGNMQNAMTKSYTEINKMYGSLF